MKVVIKPLGGLAITIFIIFLIAPFIYTYYNYYKIPKFQLILKQNATRCNPSMRRKNPSVLKSR